MADSNMRRIYMEVSSLTVREKMSILSKLIADVSSAVEKNEAQDIYSLKGLGKEIWKGMDAQEYVDAERASWI